MELQTVNLYVEMWVTLTRHTQYITCTYVFVDTGMQTKNQMSNVKRILGNICLPLIEIMQLEKCNFSIFKGQKKAF